YQRVIAVNLIGTFNVMRLAAAAMAKTEPADADGQRGVIATPSSVAVIEGQTGQIAYSASKGGIIGMTVPGARDLAAIGVRVNTICPGIIDTPIYGFSENAEEFKARLVAPVVFPKRMGRADEFAHLVRSLIENDYMNAEVIRFDGGIRFQPKEAGRGTHSGTPIVLAARMCGITGCLALADGAGPDTEWVGRAAMRLAHRGPDDEAFFADQHLALGFRRLAVVDTSAAGRHPLRAGDRPRVAGVRRG